MTIKPRSTRGAIGASTPPTSIQGKPPHWIVRAAYPIASVDEVQPVETTWLRPRKPKRIDTSLASVPMVDVGIV